MYAIYLHTDLTGDGRISGYWTGGLQKRQAEHIGTDPMGRTRVEGILVPVLHTGFDDKVKTYRRLNAAIEAAKKLSERTMEPWFGAEVYSLRRSKICRYSIYVEDLDARERVYHIPSDLLR